MAEYTLAGEARTVLGKQVKQLRREGIVPGTIYGPKTDPVSVQFNHRELQVALMNAGGTNLIDVTVGKATYPVVARDVQRHIMKGDILHVDFIAVDMTSTIRIDVPIHVTGESPVVAARQGVLLTGPNALTVEMMANKMINEVVIDLSVLTELGATITVADLNLGDDVHIINDEDEMIVKVTQTSAARAAEDLAAEEGEGEEGEEGEGEESEDDSE